MAKRSTQLECNECSEKFSLSSKSPESVSYCPFCGASLSVPYDDVDTTIEDDDYTEEDDE